MGSIALLKNLLVAATETAAEGSRAQASNLLELALDQMETLSAEDVEVGLQVVTDAETSCTTELTEDDLEPETEGTETASGLYQLLDQMVRA